jgi:hypothetical protein
MSGDFQMIRLDTGDRLTIKMDGSEIRDSIHLLAWSIAISAITRKRLVTDPMRQARP